MNKSFISHTPLNIRRRNRTQQGRLIGFVAFLGLLTLLFTSLLSTLVAYALNSELHSYIILVPFISGYVLYIHREQFPQGYHSSISWAVLFFVGGLVSLAAAIATGRFQPTLIALAFVCFVVTAGFVFLGKDWMKAATFPFAFLLFTVPLPDSTVRWLETISKLASADCANFILHLTGTPVLRDGTIFQLPGIAIEVAQECSGIRSSWILVIASILTAYLFLGRSSNRLLLVAVAIPLGILRNGFRIAVIALLCVSFGPRMIHSPIHTHGGPLFFALSLIPLFFFLWLLRRREKTFGAMVSDTYEMGKKR